MSTIQTRHDDDTVLLDQTCDTVDSIDAALDWSRARCSDGAGTLTELFFSDDPIDIARAKAICSKCTLQEACLSGALTRAESFGVWGGQLFVNGAVVAHKRRRGRPPKHPRPELVVDEVIIPPHLVKTA